MLPGKKYTPEELLRIARKRIWLLLMPLAVVSATTALVAKLLPDLYRSETLILVVPQRIPEAYVKSTVTMRIEDRLQAIKQQILSRTVLERTINEFNLYADERQTQIMEDIVGRMRNDIFIEVVRGDAFRVRYVGRDPGTVMRVTASLTSSFIDQSLKDRSSLAEGTNQFLEAQLVEARRRLIENEQKLEVYNRKYAGELPTQQGSNLQAITNIQMQIQAILNDIERSQDRRRTLERDVRDLEQTIDVDATNVPVLGTASMQTPVAGTAAEALAIARAQLAGMRTRKLKDDHPEVRAQQRLIQELERRADAEALQQPVTPIVAPRGVSTAAQQRQKRIEGLRAELEQLDRQIASKLAEEKRLRANNDTYQYRVEMAPTRASELVELTRDYDQLQRLYSSLLAKKEESKIAANLEQRQIGEQFRLLDPAVLPEKPFKPNRALINVIGMAVGLALGIGFIALIEYRDTSFKTDTEVAGLLALPVLAVVPLMRSDGDQALAARRQLVLRLALGSTVCGCLAVLVYTFVR